jgi:16S rRNA (guanine(1405)-N(7))-methyltransferase
MENLKKKILEKKELKGIPLEFLDKFLEEYKRENYKTYKKLEDKNFNEKSKEFDELKKEIRRRIREVHGVFSKEPISRQKKEKYLYELKTGAADKKEIIIQKILASHQSTFERMNNYEELYKKIFEDYDSSKNQKKPLGKIIDLGCGYNPFAYTYISALGFNPEYFAVDINKEDAEFIQRYFDATKIKGRSEVIDLTEDEGLKIIEDESKNSKICLMFKLLDSLEAKKRGSSAKLMNAVNSKRIIVSFPLKTISGKNIIKGKRKWFEKIKTSGKFEVEELALDNEQYYILKRID